MIQKKLSDNQNTKEKKLIDKFKNKKIYKNQKYITKSVLKKRIKNSQSFFNFKDVDNNGIIYLKNNQVAKIFSIEPIDLSLTSNVQKQYFFEQFKYLFQIKNLDLRFYKIDEKLDLNNNKDYYQKLINDFSNDELKLSFLKNRYDFLCRLESQNLTTTSLYYMVLVANDTNELSKMSQEVEMQCSNTIPKLFINRLINKLEIYQFLLNLYFGSCNLEQLLWYDFTELIVPLSIKESTSNLIFDDKELQMVTIKNIAPFVDEQFLDELFNIPNARCCIHIQDTIDTENLIRRLDSNYEMLLSERSMTRKLSDATEMDREKENFQELMNQIKNGDESIKEVSFIIAISGNKKEREELLKDLKRIGNVQQVKLEAPKMRQYELWQAYDIGNVSLKDYTMYLPSLTLSASFPFSVSYFNDSTGYMLGVDVNTELPVFFNPFFKDEKRPSSNMAVVATTGGGKSFFIKKIIVNEINRGNRVFILDAEGEYENLVRLNGGVYIDMYSPNGGLINPLQVRFLPDDKENFNPNYKDCPLSKHLGALETFFKCVFEKISEKEIVVLLDMIEKLYARFGITMNTKIETLSKLENTDFPIFDDAINFIDEYKKMITNSEKLKIVDQLEILMDRFKVGVDAMLFNNYTNVDLSADLIAFNVKDLLYSKNRRITTTQLINLFSYLNNIIVNNQMLNQYSEIQKYISVIVEELHLYFKNADVDVMTTIEQLARQIRKKNGSLIPSSQSIHDFVGDDIAIRSATAIFNNCQYQLVGMLQEDDLKAYLKLFYKNPLTETQIEFLSSSHQGQFLLTINREKRIRLETIASQDEKERMGV